MQILKCDHDQVLYKLKFCVTHIHIEKAASWLPSSICTNEWHKDNDHDDSFDIDCT